MADLLKDNTNKALISMSLPISLGMLSTFLFQVIDTYFVGQLGAAPLAALSFSSTLYFTIVALFIGLSVGVSILVGQGVGKKEWGKVKSNAGLGILVSLILGILLSGLCILLIDPLFSTLGAEEQLIPMIKEYTIPLLIGIPILTSGLMIGAVLRATGNIKKPEIIMAFAGIINLILDYLLIFGKFGFPELGIKGAAYATVISWLFVIVGMVILLIQDKLWSISDIIQAQIKKEVSNIFKLSGPTILTQVIGPITLMFLTYLLARHSTLAVAAFGVASRIETLLMIGILGVSTAITPFIAQNAGANKKDRIEAAIKFGGKASTYLGLIMATILFLFIKPIATIFNDNSEIIAHTSNYFYIVGLSYIFYGLFLITTSILNGLQLTLDSFKISLIKSLLFSVPLTIIGSFWGINGIFIGISMGNILAGVYASIRMKKEFKKTYSSLSTANIRREYWDDIKHMFKK